MDVRQLKFFLGVAQYESFTKAAEQLHIAQPALCRFRRNRPNELT